jgi:hypothetical protein
MKSRDRPPAVLRETAGMEPESGGPFELPPLPHPGAQPMLPMAIPLPRSAGRPPWPPLAIFAVTAGAIASGLVILLALLAVFVLVVDVRQSEPLRRIRMVVTAPAAVQEGAVADVTVVVTDARPAAVEARQITLSREVLDRFDAMEATAEGKPLAMARRGELSFGSDVDLTRARSYQLQRDLPPGQSATVRLRLKARKPGVCVGSVIVRIAEGQVERPLVLTVQPQRASAPGGIVRPPAPMPGPAPPQTRGAASPSSFPHPGSGRAGR